jgi:hypothetical protein
VYVWRSNELEVEADPIAIAAIELERLWNELAREMPFSLFRSYRSASVSGSEREDSLRHVCQLHSSVLAPMDAPDARDQRAAQSIDSACDARFEPEHGSPGRARRLVCGRLREMGHAEALVEDAALVLSELANNAVLHARSAFSVAVQIEDSALRVAIEDGSPLDAGATLPAQRGHGLGVIDALATRWGVERKSDGKVVWAELRT